MTVKAKAIVEAFYGNGPRLSYFVGCSTGGRQGLMEAQRFPERLRRHRRRRARQLLDAPDGGIAVAGRGDAQGPGARTCRPASWQLLNKAALAACDARDGVTDGLIENPLACRFDPGTLLCTGAESETLPHGSAGRGGEEDLRPGR